MTWLCLFSKSLSLAHAVLVCPITELSVCNYCRLLPLTTHFRVYMFFCISFTHNQIVSDSSYRQQDTHRKPSYCFSPQIRVGFTRELLDNNITKPGPRFNYNALLICLWYIKLMVAVWEKLSKNVRTNSIRSIISIWVSVIKTSVAMHFYY